MQTVSSEDLSVTFTYILPFLVIQVLYIIQIYSGITSGRVLEGELLYTKILEVNLFAFAYKLFHEDFSPINGALRRGSSTGLFDGALQSDI